MNIFRTAAFRASALALALPFAAVFITGCEVGSTDSTTAVAADNSGTIYNFAGLYMNPDNEGTNVLELVYPATTASHPSGVRITYLRLLQYGTVLEAYDSAGLTWNGSISAIQSGTATFSLQGQTTAGQHVDIAGTMVYASQQSTMDATWIEPNYYGNLYAKATVAPSATNSSTTSVTMSPSSAVTLSSGGTKSFTATGGSGSYTWELSTTSYGSLSSYSGSPVTITANGATGTTSITVYDSDDSGNYDSNTIYCQ